MSYYHQKKTISLTPPPTKPFTNSIKFKQLQKKITKQAPPLKGRINSLLQEGHFAPRAKWGGPNRQCLYKFLKSQNLQRIQRQPPNSTKSLPHLTINKTLNPFNQRISA